MSRRTLAAAVLLLASACAIGGPARPREPVPFEVRGTVLEAPGGVPAVAVQVRMGNTGLAVVTDRSGAFRLRGTLPPGRYLLTTARVGFQPARRRVRIRRAGPVDAGTLVIRAVEIQLDDLAVPETNEGADRP